MKARAQSNALSELHVAAGGQEARSLYAAVKQAAVAASQGGAVFTLTEGGVADLRSVPEQSLADSIFSLEDGHVQNLQCVTACARAWGGGVRACLTGCQPPALCSELAAADQ